MDHFTVNNAESGYVGLVVIGRNEGARLATCLRSTRQFQCRVYVDSGSADGSVALARAEGLPIVELVSPPPFSAARARNAGLERLLQLWPALRYVQMIDGDCELQSAWLDQAVPALEGDSALALVFGRRRERHPERSVYNALCDDEWNIPIGRAAGCGGDALFRISALRSVNFYNGSMIAGEDSELCMRLRKSGWRLQRIDAEMTIHDAAMTSFRQWWRRTQRSGHGFAEMARLHPDARDPNWPRTVRSIVAWGGVLPALLCIDIAVSLSISGSLIWLAVLLLSIWLAKVLLLIRVQRRRGLASPVARASGLLLMVGKLPQFRGVIGYHCDRLFGRKSRLIEYHPVGGS